MKDIHEQAKEYADRPNREPFFNRHMAEHAAFLAGARAMQEAAVKIEAHDDSNISPSFSAGFKHGVERLRDAIRALLPEAKP